MNGIKRNPILIFFFACVIVAYAFSFFWAGDRFGMTPFRESQTAITSYYMSTGESPFLAYYVPVLGKDWSVPMEFPLYQWIAAKMGGADVIRLCWAGRLLSWIFWGLSLGVLDRNLRLSPLRAESRWGIIAFSALAPVFVAYSTAFLIESFALFWALIYFWFFLRWLQNKRKVLSWGGAIAFGVVAAWVKPTTWAPFAAAIAVTYSLELLCDWRERLKNWKKTITQIGGVGFLLFLPMVAALWWVHLGDEIKLQNPVAAGLISENLSSWNYGTLAQKLSPRVWSILLGKQLLLLFGPMGILVPFIWLLGFFKGMRNKEEWKLVVALLVSFAGYFSAPVVFTNLHFRHDYYLVANGLFAVIAAGLSLEIILRNNRSRWFSCFLVLSIFSSMGTALGYTAIRKSFREPVEDAVLENLKALPGKDPVIFLGFGWSSYMPYFSERKALMVDIDSVTDERMQGLILKNKEIPWAALVMADEKYETVADALVTRLELEFPYKAELWPGVNLWSRQEVPVGTGKNARQLLAGLSAKLEGVEVPSKGIVYQHSFIKNANAGEGWFELIFRRGNELYYFNGSRFTFMRLKNYFQESSSR